MLGEAVSLALSKCNDIKPLASDNAKEGIMNSEYPKAMECKGSLLYLYPDEILVPLIHVSMQYVPIDDALDLLMESSQDEIS